MTVKITGLREKAAKLTLFRQKFREKVWQETINSAEDIMEESINLAPVDTGDLENSHYIYEDKNNGAVYVAFHAVKDGFDYGVEMHESSYNLGEKSLEKQRSTGKEIGRKFLVRAIKAMKEQSIQNVKDATQAAIRESGVNK